MGSEETLPPRTEALSPFDVDEFRKLAHQMVDFVADYHLNIESFPVRSQVEPGYLKQLLPDSAPEEPESLDDVLSDVRSKIFPGITHWQSPKFFAYYPSNCSTASYLGDMLSGAFNVIGFSWISSPAAIELETIVLDWLGKLLQLPVEFLSTGGTGGGVIQGTASEAVLVVMLAARQIFVDKLTKQGLSEADAFGKLVTYTSDQTHSCVQKASQIAGLSGNLQVLPTDPSTNFALSPAVVVKAVEEDFAKGLLPFFLCGTVGTTSSSAVDPISDLGNISLDDFFAMHKYGMWFHVDGANAGSACICPEFRPYLDGIEKANSFCMNPHKWLLTNFDCSALWVKDSKSLSRALSTSPEYLRNKVRMDETWGICATSTAVKYVSFFRHQMIKQVVDYKDLQIPLGRRFRSLKLWFVLRMYGASGLGDYIRNHVSVAQHLENLVRADGKFELVTPRNLSLVCFRLKPLPKDTDNGKTLNDNLLEAVNNSGNAFLTHTTLSGIFTLRMAVGGTKTERRHVDDKWSTIKTEAEHLLASEAE